VIENIARLLSLNVGLPRDITWQGKRVHTATALRLAKGEMSASRRENQHDREPRGDRRQTPNDLHGG
jgi:hypothetical protein